MLINFLRSIWIKLPKFIRLWAVYYFEPRFNVSVGAIIQNEQGQILLLKHVFRPGSGWGVPGGFISNGEQPEKALQREMEEETGLQIENIRLAFVHTLAPRNHVEIIFFADTNSEAKIKSVEISEIGWFSIDDLPDGVHHEQLKVIKRALKDGVIRQS
jgi:mutator protein MutT